MEYCGIGSETHYSTTPLKHFFLPELSQKSQIILKKQSDIVNPILQHRDSLYPHAESESRKFLRIVADKMEHLGIDHAGAEDF